MQRYPSAVPSTAARWWNRPSCLPFPPITPAPITGKPPTLEEDRFDYGETRYQTYGLPGERAVMIVGTPRGDARHIVGGDVIEPAEGSLTRRRGRPKLDASKRQVSVRLDPDVLQGLRGLGAGWQGEMNRALREWLERRQAR